MSAFGFGFLLLALWVLLWGSASLANVLSGVLVISLLLWSLPDARFRLRPPQVRPIPALRFVGRVAVNLVRANAVVTKEILTPDTSIRTGVVAVPLDEASDGLLTLMANVLSLSPGTLPVEVTREPPAVYIHVLHLRDVEEVRSDVQHLSALAIRAFGSDAAVAALDARTGARP